MYSTSWAAYPGVDRLSTTISSYCICKQVSAKYVDDVRVGER